tara:strand:+ start:137 stop:325 length:189 start_codon:yes stop_codon:yes gene_type:complete
MSKPGEESERRDREANRIRDRALKRMLNTPPTPHVNKASSKSAKETGEAPAKDTSPVRKNGR